MSDAQKIETPNPPQSVRSYYRLLRKCVDPRAESS